MMYKKIPAIFLALGLQFAVAQNRYDIVISELMIDPTPAVALPAVEFIELKNVSALPVNLAGWRLADAAAQSGPLPAYTLKPDSFLIVCSSGSLPLLQPFGAAVSVTAFPSLDNDADVITLRSNTGKTIHAVAYTAEWYQNPVKADGGWSLEITDTRNPCDGIDNWKASNDPAGGSPGKKNANDAANNDTRLPQLVRTYTNNTTQVVAVFNEPLDSTAAAIAGNYSFEGNRSVVSAQPVAPVFQQVILNLSAPLAANTVYNLTVNNVTDCRGNAIGAFRTARSGLPVEADSLELVVNELLFNPPPNGFDFVEYYNRSNKIFDAGKLFVANRNTAGAIANVKKMSEQPFLVFPGDFITLTENRSFVLNRFGVKNENLLLQIPALPALNDDAGTAILLNTQGKIIDEVSYRDDWHFPLLNNKEGISLERIAVNGPSQNAANWHSAAFTAGYGTPTARNSQFSSSDAGNNGITLSPPVFSPDNDGTDDVLTIGYRFAERGNMANVTVFNASGNPVRQLKNNELCGLAGSWNWDGLSDSRTQLPMGIYIVWVEIFDLKGRKQAFKNAVTLARRF